VSIFLTYSCMVFQCWIEVANAVRMIEPRHDA
jgi:hypothetical protein